MYRSYNNDRFGGAFVPFVLGGIAGSLWNNNNNNGVVYYPYPTPYPYPYTNTYQYPYYQYNTYY